MPVKEASFSFHNSSLCIGLLSPVTDMRSSGGIDGHKNLSKYVPSEMSRTPKPSLLGPDVSRDKGAGFHGAARPRRIAAVLFRHSGRPFTFSYAQVASSQRGLKIERRWGLAEPGHVTVRLSVPVHVLSAPQMRFGWRRGGGVQFLMCCL